MYDGLFLPHFSFAPLADKMKLLIVACLSVFAVASPSPRYLRDAESSDATQGHVKGHARVAPNIGLDSDEDAYVYPDSARRLLGSFRRTPGFGFGSTGDDSPPAQHFRQLLDEDALDSPDSARRLLESFRRTPGFGFGSTGDDSPPTQHFRQLSTIPGAA
ncbi:unnamed protein product [Aphanomyces euteiches]